MADTTSTPDIPRHRPSTTTPAGSDASTGPEADLVGGEPVTEGVIYLTPDGDGYILYASFPTNGLATAC